VTAVVRRIVAGALLVLGVALVAPRPVEGASAVGPGLESTATTRDSGELEVAGDAAEGRIAVGVGLVVVGIALALIVQRRLATSGRQDRDLR